MVSAQAMPERRREPRAKLTLPVNVSGADSHGRPFEQAAIATDLSSCGALLHLRQRIVHCTVIRISYEGNTARFRIAWRGAPESHPYTIAVCKFESDRCPWKELLTAQECVPEIKQAEIDSAFVNNEQSDADEDEATKKSYRQTRRWQRHKVDVPIRVIVHRPEKTTLYDGRGNELSEGGMALTAGVELIPGDTVDIEFTPPYSGLPIRHTGIVRNRTGYRYGVEFLSDSSEDVEQTERLLDMLTST